ncbi:glycosyltransferase family 4 protein [bacterium]|nr:glycosyltransferase family 4 protein [bacterium]
MMNKTVCIIQNNIITGKSGGYEIQIYNLFQKLVKKGWTVSYFAEGKQYQEYTFDGFQVYIVPKRHYFSFYNPELFYHLERQAISIVYQRSRTAFSAGNIGLRFARRKKAKFVFSIGSPDDLIPFFLTKSLWKSKTSFAKKLFASVDTIIKDILFKRNFLKSDMVISQNISQQFECKKRFKRNSTIIRSGHPAPLPDTYVKDSPLSVCWIANVRAVKQPELFLELARKCEDISTRSGTQFIMVMGKNIANYEKTRFMEKLKTQPNMLIIGEQSIDEANAVMGRSSLLVNTSVYEGFSNTYIQAWMRETPVVTLHCDPDGIIENHKLGFHSRSFDQLVTDVRYLIENESIRQEMGNNARVYALENHSIEKSAEAMNDLLTKLIE